MPWAPPVRLDGRFDGELGVMLGRMLERANDGSGDWVYVMESNGVWRGLGLDEGKVWREADGTVSRKQLGAGEGMVWWRRSWEPMSVVVGGPVGNDGSRVKRVERGWNLMGLSEGRDVRLLEILGSLPPMGERTDGESDVVVVRDAEGRWRRWMYVAGWGEPYDGQWFNLSTYELVPSNMVMRPGEAYYYLRRGEAGDISF